VAFTESKAAGEMQQAALDVLDCLTPEQRQRVNLPFDEDERRTWFYTPTFHGGLPLTDIAWHDQRRVLKLVSSGLSAGGYATVALIMGATHDILERVNGWAPLGTRDSRYFVTIFGAPGPDERWGWRFGGHHLSLNYTIDQGRVSRTPNFFGLDPSTTPLIGGYQFRPLAGLEDLARELVADLDDRQRDIAVVCAVAPMDVVTGNRPRVLPGARPPHLWETSRGRPEGEQLAALVARDERMMNDAAIREEHLAQLEWARTPIGLPVHELNAKQREIFDRLLEQYLGRMPDDFADRERERLAHADGMLHFAWAGGLSASQPHYYRIQGSQLLLEYDSFHRDGNHIHAVWRNPDDDFGDDILAGHIALDH
jgi:hypothetical protein